MKHALFAALWCAVAFSARAEVGAAFAKANQEYAAGHFREAADAYEAIAQGDGRSASVFYNLGNARFRLNDLGGAILNYERALALDPNLAEAQANLRLVRDRARALELAKQPLDRYRAAFTTTQWSWLGAAAFWLAVLALVTRRFARTRSALSASLATVGVLVFVASAVAIYLEQTGPRGHGLAVVQGKDVQARLATADNANAVLALPAGSEVKILSTRGEWSYAALPNDLHGWIPTRSAEAVRF